MKPVRYAIIPIILLVMLAASCVQPPEAELASARQAIGDASFHQAQAKCPDLFLRAQDHLRKAEEAMKAEKWEVARAEAERASILAGKTRLCLEADRNAE